jgi:hypothetical protein
MAHVTLPLNHLPGDLELAMRVARGLAADELHVYWTPEAELRAEALPQELVEASPRVPTGWVVALGSLFVRLGERLAEPRAGARTRGDPPEKGPPAPRL